ncbi:substrate-binding domain-containing protein [Halopenitus malekzadehii]|uniref:ABC transporter substrate-binding protein n=1 Tax=Halopenitus malekzadehii TaxID=1267564 RepID=UPI000B84AA78|nr:ABC transporter substrate-binding protein [Halopenitus malekzadehii]
MTEPNITLASSLTDRTAPLFNEEVSPKGVDLNFVPLSVEETFWRMLDNAEFDASEMSMSSYMMTRAKEDPPFVAIPVFPSRFFRHSCVFINSEADIEDPSDLKGKKVGVPEYQMTASLWVRGILADEYGVAPADVEWYHGGEEDPGREEKLALDLPEDISLSYIPGDRTLSGMIGDGTLDALVTARTPSSFDGESVVRLFPNFRDVEREYYQKTGHFPIMHTVVLRTDVYEENPWIAQELNKAFHKAKELCLERIGDTTALQNALPWLHGEVERTREIMGDDYWPYGVEANRDTLETMTRYSYEQGLTEEKLDIGDLFAPNTYREFKV